MLEGIENLTSESYHGPDMNPDDWAILKALEECGRSAKISSKPTARKLLNLGLIGTHSDKKKVYLITEKGSNLLRAKIEEVNKLWTLLNKETHPSVTPNYLDDNEIDAHNLGYRHGYNDDVSECPYPEDSKLKEAYYDGYSEGCWNA